MTSNSTQGGPWDSNGHGGSGVGGNLDAEYDEPYEISVNNGLTLNAVRQSVVGANYVNGQIVAQTFPVTASVVDTYGKMEFTGGYLQIVMKAPAGDGAWPSLWLLPGAGAGTVGNNFEIDIQEGGYYDGSANPNAVMAYHLHTPAGTFGGVIDTGVDLTKSFNTYAIDWIPGKSITWYLNGAAIAEITSAQAPIPNEPMELIMSNQVASSAASSWRTTLDSSTPYSMPMRIASVQLYQTPGSGETMTGGNVSLPSAPTITISTASATTTQTAQTISGTVDIADVGSTVTIFDGASRIGSAGVGASGQWSTGVELTHQGVNVLSATATNVAGTGTSALLDLILTSPPSTALPIVNSAGDLNYSLDDRNYNIVLGGFSNHIAAGDGADSVCPGAGQETIVLGDGNDIVTLSGYGNTVTTGNGDDRLSGGLGASVVKLGNGGNFVDLGGYYNDVSVGDGANVINAGAGNETIAAGAGVNAVSLSGFYNTLQLGAGDNIVVGGEGGDNITLSGGSAKVTLPGANEHLVLNNGVNAHIFDQGAGLQMDLTSNYGSIALDGLAQDPSGAVHLLDNGGGFTSADQILGALRNDGHGGSVLALGITGSLDIVGVGPASLHASNFGF